MNVAIKLALLLVLSGLQISADSLKPRTSGGGALGGELGDHVLLDNPLSSCPLKGFVQVNTNIGVYYLPMSTLAGIVEITDQNGKIRFLYFRNDVIWLGGHAIVVEVEDKVMSREKLFDLLNQSTQELPARSQPTTKAQ
jgi:hypothetical protein